MGSNQEKKKEQIILAAIILFSKKGFSKTSMADIAKEAGIGKGTTYEYFKGKDQLFLATFEWFVEQSEKAITLSFKELAPKSSAEKIQVFSKSILDSMNESKEFYPLVLEFWAATASSKYRNMMKKAFKDLYKDIGDILVAIVKEGIDNNEFDSGVDIDSVVPAIVGAWDTIGLQAWFYDGLDDEFNMEKTMQSFTDLIIRGLLRKQ
ncbi:MAG: TetR/AcrR family transcriptional regulator [Desulfobacteraceae bacterium]|nr:TetR/AcrR family transcriptional regulator [Desulfobacteraceae bacterium]